MEEELTQRPSTARITFSTTLRRDSSTRFILPALAEPLGKHPLVPIVEDVEQSATVANRDNVVADPQVASQPQTAGFDSAQRGHMSPADPAAPSQSWVAGPESTPSAYMPHVDSGNSIAGHSCAPGLASPQFDFPSRSYLYDHEHGAQFNTSTWNSRHDLFGAGVSPILGQFTMSETTQQAWKAGKEQEATDSNTVEYGLNLHGEHGDATRMIAAPLLHEQEHDRQSDGANVTSQTGSGDQYIVKRQQKAFYKKGCFYEVITFSFDEDTAFNGSPAITYAPPGTILESVSAIRQTWVAHLISGHGEQKSIEWRPIKCGDTFQFDHGLYYFSLLNPERTPTWVTKDTYRKAMRKFLQLQC